MFVRSEGGFFLLIWEDLKMMLKPLGRESLPLLGSNAGIPDCLC